MRIVDDHVCCSGEEYRSSLAADAAFQTISGRFIAGSSSGSGGATERGGNVSLATVGATFNLSVDLLEQVDVEAPLELDIIEWKVSPRFYEQPACVFARYVAVRLLTRKHSTPPCNYRIRFAWRCAHLSCLSAH